jgi:hypothetical protein
MPDLRLEPRAEGADPLAIPVNALEHERRAGSEQAACARGIERIRDRAPSGVDRLQVVTAGDRRASAHDADGGSTQSAVQQPVHVVEPE